MLDRDTVILIILCNTGVLVVNFLTLIIALTRQSVIAKNFTERLNKIMATIDEVQDAGRALAKDVKTLKAGVEAYIAANPNNSQGLQDLLDSLKSTDADVKATDAEVEPPTA